MLREPTLDAERALWLGGKTRVAGVDEAGLGSLCGAVVAAAVVIPANCVRIPEVRDSKTLSLEQRERLFEQIVEQAVAVGAGAASVVEIERLNVLTASRLAMLRALRRVTPYDHALVDGRAIKSIDLGPHTAIVDGDASSYAIACASIIAKVTRDRLMRRMARRFPQYGWDHNAGYGTREHLAALQKIGVTPYHRRSYAPVRAVLESPAFPPEIANDITAESAEIPSLA